MSNLGTLTLDLVAKTGGFTGPLDKAERKSRDTSRKIAKHQKEVRSSLAATLKPLAGYTAGFLSVAGVVSFTKNSLQAADAIGKVAATAGVTTDTIQEMRHAASLNGIAFGDLDNGMQQFNKRIGEARAGTGSLYTYLMKTDEALLHQVKSAKSTDEALDLVFKSMENVASSSDRSALSVAAFGRSGQRLAIMADTYSKLRKEARDLGLIIDEELIRNAEEANDKMDTMSRIISTQLTASFIELAPTIIEVTGLLTSATMAISRFFKVGNTKGPDRFDLLSGELESLQVALKDAEESGVDSFVTITKSGDVFTNTIGSARAQIKILKDELSKLPSAEVESVGSTTDGTAEVPSDDSWSKFGEILKKTSDHNKQRLEIIKDSNKAMAEERDRQLQEDIARDENYRSLVQQADMAQLNNIKDSTERELAIHEYKYEKLRDIYEEGSQELAEIERAAAADRVSILEENTYWESYLESLENNMSDMDSIVGDSLSKWSSEFGDFFADAILDSENLGESFKKLGMGMVRTMISSIGQMIAQWVTYKITTFAIDKATKAAAAPGLVANAQAASLQAGLNAYASAAAIPLIGFAIAPGAMAAAIATTQPVAAAVSSLAVAGMAHDGMDSIPETGTWLLEKGERVLTSQTSKRLDNTLNRIQSDTVSGVGSNGFSGGSSVKKEPHYHYHSDGPTFLNRAQFKDAARMLMSEIEHESTRKGAV